MINKSTQKSVPCDKDNVQNAEPAESSLIFLRMYARCCHIEKKVKSPFEKVCLN